MICLYHGKSFLSRLIRFRTWSCYSHVSWLDDSTGEVYEAWIGGVRRAPNINYGHKPGTLISMFDVKLTQAQSKKLLQFFNEQVGRGYDYLGILGFAFRGEFQNQNKWFCSELIAGGFKEIGKPLLERIPNWKVYPGMLAYSPLLKWAGAVKTCKN